MNFMKLGLFNKRKSFQDTPAFPQKILSMRKKFFCNEKDFVATRLVSVICSSEPSPARSSLTDQLQQMHARSFGSKTKTNIKNDKDNQLVSYLVIFMRGKKKKNTSIGNVKNEEKKHYRR